MDLIIIWLVLVVFPYMFFSPYRDCRPFVACARHGRCWTHSYWDMPPWTIEIDNGPIQPGTKCDGCGTTEAEGYMARVQDDFSYGPLLCGECDKARR